jgi:hypothetical protein
MKEFLFATTAMIAVTLAPLPKDTTKTAVQQKKTVKKTEKKPAGEINEDNSFSIFNFTFKFQ